MTEAVRVVVVAESPTDEAVVIEIVATVRGAPADAVAASRTLTRGWPAVLNRLPDAVRRAHFDPTVDALVALADADRSPVHDPTTHAPERPVAGCRLCEMRAVVVRELAACAPAPGRAAPLKVAVGTPVPTLEAWLLAGVRPDVTEAAWAVARREGRAQATPGALKLAAYGGRNVVTGIMRPRARTLIREALERGDLLATTFPGGYAPLEDAIRAW